jgi:hypothetical protein
MRAREKGGASVSASLKAGLIGAAGAAVLSLVGSLVPCIGCFTFILTLALYAGMGALAAYWLDPPRTAGQGGGAGAIAGLITAVVGGLVNLIVGGIRFAVSGGAPAVLDQLPPEVMQQLGDVGVELGALVAGIGGFMAISTVCCVVGLALAAGLGALGGAITASTKPE